MVLEAIRYSLNATGGWIDENLFHLDRDRAQMPGQILQEALKRVGYKKSALQFTLERYENGWSNIPFGRELLAITFNRVAGAIDIHKEATGPELMKEDGRVFRSIVHAFCYENKMPGSSEFPAKDWLVIKTTVSHIEGFTEHGQLEIDYRQKIYDVADLMLQIGLMRQKPRENGDYLYLTNQIDPLLA